MAGKDFPVERLEKFLSLDLNRELRVIWRKLKSQGCDLNKIARVLVPVSRDDEGNEEDRNDEEESRMDCWTVAKGEAGRRDLWRRVAPRYKAATTAIERLDQAAATLLRVAELPPEETQFLQPKEIADRLRDLLSRLTELRGLLRKEAAAERIVMTDPPKGRPPSWHAPVDVALKGLHVRRVEARALVRIVGAVHGVQPTYSRGGL